MLTDTIRKMMHILAKKEEEYKVEVGATYSKQPIPFPWEEQTQSLQGKNNNQNMHVDQDYKEEDVESCLEYVESCQVSTRYLPISCLSLLREH